MTTTRTVDPPGSATTARCADRFSPRSSRSTSVAVERLADEQAVAVLGPAGPAADRAVAALAGRADEAVLLHHVDDLLEPEQVRLERGHVGEDERQALVPAVGEVADVERGDVQPVHRARVDGFAVASDDRQRERERRAHALLGLDPDPAAVLLDDVARDREAEARAADPRDARPVDLVEPLEDPGLVGLRDADPVVLDGRDQLGVDAPRRGP